MSVLVNKTVIVQLFCALCNSFFPSNCYVMALSMLGVYFSSYVLAES